MMLLRAKADLVYGASGTRKTSNIGLAALYVKRKYNKNSRLVTLDGGGFDVLLPLVEEGIIQPWSLMGRSELITSVDFACQGYWAADTNDPKSPLLKPTAKTWDEIGMIAFEGLTSIGDAMYRQLKARGASLSQDPSYKWSEGNVVVDDKPVGLTYSGGNMTYFGFVQDQLYDLVMKTHQLPVEKVPWTALEGKGEEEGSRNPVYGPSIIGRKATGKATQWFGNSVHIEQLVEQKVDDKTKQMSVIERPIMYLRTHADPLSRIPFPAKTRAPFQLAGQLPEYLDPPDLGRLYELLDELNEKARKLISIPAAAASLPDPAKAPIPVVEPPKPAVATAIPSQAVFIPPRIATKSK